MSITCSECSIRYAADLAACPWCGHLTASVTAPAKDPAPAIPVPGAASAAAPSSVSSDRSAIPGPDEDGAPDEEWVTDAEPSIPEHDTDARTRLKRWARLGLAGAALVVFGGWLAEVLPISLSSGGDSDAAATAPRITAAAPAATTQPPPPQTTLPPPTAPPATEAPPATVAFIEPIGAGLTDLALFEQGLGPIEFGEDGTQAVGRLVATLGQPDEDSGQVPAPDAAGGICPGELQRHVRWGSLSIYNRVGGDGVESFASVVVSSAAASDPDPAAALTTRSGLRLGNSIDEMRAIYDGYEVATSSDEAVTTFELLAASDGRVLLWGTATADEALTITSIRSPLRCNA